MDSTALSKNDLAKAAIGQVCYQLLLQDLVISSAVVLLLNSIVLQWTIRDIHCSSYTQLAVELLHS